MYIMYNTHVIYLTESLGYTPGTNTATWNDSYSLKCTSFDRKKRVHVSLIQILEV